MSICIYSNIVSTTNRTEPSSIHPHPSGIAQHIHFAVADCVLLAAGGNHSADVAGGAAARQIRTLHHDPGHIQVSLTQQKVAGLRNGVGLFRR